MAFLAGAIKSKLELDTSAFSRAIKTAKTNVQGFGGFVEKNSKKFRQFGQAATIAGGAIVGTLGLMVKNYVKAGDEVHKMALRTGFSTERLSELRYAAQIAGADIGALEKGVKRMAKTIVDAGEGMATYQRAFERINVDYEKLIGLSPEEQFDKIATAIANVEDPTVRAATAQDIFGRAGTKLLPLFAAGAEGLEELKQKAHEMGIVFDQEAANKAARLADAQTTLKQAVSGLAILIADHIVPAITGFVEKISGIITKFKDWGKEHEALAGMITKVVSGLGGLLLALGPISMMLPTLIKGVGGLKIAFTALKSPVGMVATAFAGGLFIGNLLRQIPGLDEKIQGLTASILGLDIAYDNLTEELDEVANRTREGSIRMEAMNEASKIAGREMTSLKEAYQILKEAGSETAKVIEDNVNITELLTKKELEEKKAKEELKKATEEAAGSSHTQGEVIKTITIPAIDELKASLDNLKPSQEEFNELLEAENLRIWQEGLKTADEISAEFFEKAAKDAEVLGEKLRTEAIEATNELSGSAIPGLTQAEIKAFEASKKTASFWAEFISKNEKNFATLATGIIGLGESIGGTWGGILSELGSTVNQFVSNLSNNLEGGVGGALSSVSGQLGGLGGMIGSAISGASKEGRETFARMGASLGQSIGGMFGPIGSAVGSIVGGLLGGLFKKPKTEAEKFADSVESVTKSLERYGKVSEATAKAIATDMKDGMSQAAAEAKHFDEILEDIEITQDNVEQLWSDATNTLGAIASGEISAAEGAETLGSSFNTLLESAQDFGTEGSASMVNFINQVKTSGVEVAEVTDYINDQLGVVQGSSMNAAEGLAAMAEGVGNNEEAMARLETQTLAVYSVLDKISEKHKENGTQASAAIQELLKVREVTEANKGLMSAIEGNLAVLNALGNTGSLNQETLSNAAKEAGNYYNQLTEAGLSGNQALAQMAPTLERLNYLSQEQGLSLDANTQKLINQAEEQGLIKEAQMETNDIMLAGFGEIIKALGGEIPAAMQKAMGKMAEFGEEGQEAARGIGQAGVEGFSTMGKRGDEVFDELNREAEIAGKSIEDNVESGGRKGFDRVKEKGVQAFNGIEEQSAKIGEAFKKHLEEKSGAAFDAISGKSREAFSSMTNDILSAGETFKGSFESGVKGAMGEIDRLSKKIKGTSFGAKVNIGTTVDTLAISAQQEGSWYVKSQEQLFEAHRGERVDIYHAPPPAAGAQAGGTGNVNVQIKPILIPKDDGNLIKFVVEKVNYLEKKITKGRVPVSLSAVRGTL